MLKMLQRIFTFDPKGPQELKCLWFNELRNLYSPTPGDKTITYQGGSLSCPTGICKQPMVNYDNAILLLDSKIRPAQTMQPPWSQCRIQLLQRQNGTIGSQDYLLMYNSLYCIRNQMLKICSRVRRYSNEGLANNQIAKLQKAVKQVNINARLIIEAFDWQKDFLLCL